MRKLTAELKEKSKQHLEKEVQKLREELAKLRLEHNVNPPKDTNILLKKRKRLAVVLTILGEKKELEGLKR